MSCTRELWGGGTCHCESCSEWRDKLYKQSDNPVNGVPLEKLKYIQKVYGGQKKKKRY